MKPYSLDLRQKIFDACKNGEGAIRTLAERFEASPNFIQDLLNCHRQDGTFELRLYGGGTDAKLSSHLELIQPLVEQQ